jgi:hypothetical protein
MLCSRAAAEAEQSGKATLKRVMVAPRHGVMALSSLSSTLDHAGMQGVDGLLQRMRRCSATSSAHFHAQLLKEAPQGERRMEAPRCGRELRHIPHRWIGTQDSQHPCARGKVLGRLPASK